MRKESKKFSLICDPEGKVISVLHDSHTVLPADSAGSFFFSMVVPSDLDKFLNFFIELKKNKVAVTWEINMHTSEGVEPFSLLGAIFNDTIAVAAATNPDGVQNMFFEFSRINNEQANIIRELTKEIGVYRNTGEEPTINYYEELSRLNNELVNIQRELAKKNQQLDELNKLKNQFLGMAAHDLRGPLGSIYNFTEILEEELENLTPEQSYIISLIKSSSSFMLNLVNELLDFSVIESGEIILRKENTDLSSLINQTIFLNKSIADSKSISIHCKLPESSILISIDPEKIRQVLANFITNAIKYSPPGSEIEVTAARQPCKIKVVVKDFGPGVMDEEIELLFRPFKKTSNQGTAGEKSTGLGLFICKRIVEAHQGTIGVETQPGAGSAFFFILPEGK
jgi:signal transduction histidine kinase